MYPKTLLSEKIAESIIDGIRREFYKPGDQMPNEIQLAEEFKVSRATLREAFKILISKNVLTVKRGIGTFVSEIPGFSYDALGLEFIDLKAEFGEIEKMTRDFDLEALSGFTQLSWEQQTELISQLNLKMDRLMTFVEGIFALCEQIVEYRGLEFRHRLLKIAHQSYIRALREGNYPVLNEHLNRASNPLVESCDGFVKGLATQDATIYYDDIFIRLNLLTKEA